MFCTITPTRGDRPQFLEFCKHQLSRMTVKPDRSYFIDYLPTGKDVDLIHRIREGVGQAAHDGFNEVFIIEDDDFYPADYFERMQLGDNDFIGCLQTVYYHIKDRRFQVMPHSVRSSLFMTGFRISALKDFNWPERTSPYLDISLWNHAQRYKRFFTLPGAIGIKHGIGLCGGKGHWKTLKNADPDMEWLKGHVDTEAFTFYSTL